MNYTIGDFLIRIKNAYMARKKRVDAPYSKANLSIGKILEQEGYIKKIEEKKDEGGRRVLITQLSYRGQLPVLQEVKLISKPSVSHYAGVRRVRRGLKDEGIEIVSTSKGIMSNKQANALGIGGVLICRVS